MITGQEFAEDLADQIGDGLRSVAEYDNDGYEVFYLRDDIHELYSEDDLESAYQQMDIEGSGYVTLSRVFKTGRFECATYTFEEARMFHFPIPDWAGLFVSVDRTADIDHDAIIDRCLSAIEQSG